MESYRILFDRYMKEATELIDKLDFKDEEETFKQACLDQLNEEISYDLLQVKEEKRMEYLKGVIMRNYTVWVKGDYGFQRIESYYTKKEAVEDCDGRINPAKVTHNNNIIIMEDIYKNKKRARNPKTKK